MIGQYLSNTNESAIVPILQNYLEVNKACQSTCIEMVNFPLPHGLFGYLCIHFNPHMLRWIGV